MQDVALHARATLRLLLGGRARVLSAGSCNRSSAMFFEQVLRRFPQVARPPFPGPFAPLPPPLPSGKPQPQALTAAGEVPGSCEGGQCPPISDKSSVSSDLRRASADPRKLSTCPSWLRRPSRVSKLGSKGVARSWRTRSSGNSELMLCS
ncbi:hypothetical protein CONPUDRAFT_139223, partial [Coniophora puteana RWD-64-598 SS2]